MWFSFKNLADLAGQGAWKQPDTSTIWQHVADCCRLGRGVVGHHGKPCRPPQEKGFWEFVPLQTSQSRHRSCNCTWIFDKFDKEHWEVTGCTSSSVLSCHVLVCPVVSCQRVLHGASIEMCHNPKGPKVNKMFEKFTDSRLHVGLRLPSQLLTKEENPTMAIKINKT